MKKTIVIIIFATIVGSPFEAGAAYVADISQNKIKIEGDCLSKEATVALAKTEQPEKIVYSGSVACVEWRFNFVDDLLLWNMDDGRYYILIDGRKSGKTIERKEAVMKIGDEDPGAGTIRASSVESVVIEDVAADPAPVEESSLSVPEIQSAGDGFGDAMANFGEGINQMNQSLDQMDSNYPNSKYADNIFVKTLIDLLRDALSVLANLFGQLVGDIGAAGISPSGGDKNVPAGSDNGQSSSDIQS